MKFIHAADIHLDSPFRGLRKAPDQIWEKIHNSTYAAFINMVNTAIEENVDFVLIVGDLYDRVQHSIQADLFMNEQLERLNQKQIPVYLSYGNHDYLNENTEIIHYPDNVYVFSAQPEVQQLTLHDGTTVTIVGFSYDKQAVQEDMVAKFPDRNQSDFEIGTVHGSMDSLNAPEANYAPFSKSELLGLHYDYWALGHIHKRQILNEEPAIIYSGNLQGRHKNEAGKKGFYLVTSEGHELKPKFVQASVVNWQPMKVQADSEETFDQLVAKILDQIVDLKDEKPNFINVKIENIQELTSSVLSRIEDDSLLEVVQQALLSKSMHWVYEITPVPTQKTFKLNAIDDEFWKESQKKVFTGENINQLAGSLLNQPFIAEALQHDMPIDQLQDWAETLLLKNGGREEQNDENTED
ncbi:DNA repair exonuclease [Pediococcus inopinatus]|uniref:DNA repair exonuclease n=1 Tax=Pediococcus inopinatus TaxID=114090 RepID=A0ABZ0Q629_9LACO|nr:DNA repair exonuclease [Pediococcus inopinatus]AVK99731.1 DNA repair exonuclease [Pediococcus inopinatus]KRN63195.1 metallophosphoesterase [Pediococcus inopinatus]WPC17457.1 DNA repair exonuclease [Pediococcus inopinatus]WPC18828.1 DNA repair exonuclease [Pediococcus inopinatus]WPC22445.1 DNA repair exonuclease [Pediococcus inopinatus]